MTLEKAGTGELEGPRQLVRRLTRHERPTFSVCVMLTRWPEYEECRASFVAAGFDANNTEYLVVDNSEANVADAYVALNEFLQVAQGKYIILCHQDILLMKQGREDLQTTLEMLDDQHPDWGVCGNAGYTDDGWPAMCINHARRGTERVGAPFPAEVVSLDENLLIVRRAANLALSRDLGGYHHYGPDLCIVANVLGWKAFVIDFLVLHKSEGTFDQRYFQSRTAIMMKYSRAFRPRWFHVITEAPFYIAHRPSRRFVARVLRWAGRKTGLIPKLGDLRDPTKRAARDRRRAREGGAGRAAS